MAKKKRAKLSILKWWEIERWCPEKPGCPCTQITKSYQNAIGKKKRYLARNYNIEI